MESRPAGYRAVCSYAVNLFTAASAGVCGEFATIVMLLFARAQKI
jgi:hypothetical protein